MCVGGSGESQNTHASTFIHTGETSWVNNRFYMQRKKHHNFGMPYGTPDYTYGRKLYSGDRLDGQPDLQCFFVCAPVVSYVAFVVVFICYSSLLRLDLCRA